MPDNIWGKRNKQKMMLFDLAKQLAPKWASRH